MCSLFQIFRLKRGLAPSYSFFLALLPWCFRAHNTPSSSLCCRGASEHTILHMMFRRSQWLRYLSTALAIGAIADLDAFDGFSGCGRFRKVCDSQGLNCAEYDLLAGHDCTTEAGAMHFVKLAARCKKGAIVLLGVPCHFFIFLFRPSHGKTKKTPCGNGTPFSK